MLLNNLKNVIFAFVVKNRRNVVQFLRLVNVKRFIVHKCFTLFNVILAVHSHIKYDTNFVYDFIPYSEP